MTRNELAKVFAAAPKKSFKAVAQRIAHGELLVMLPDGTVRHAMNDGDATEMIAKWTKKHTPKNGMAITLTEYR